MFPGEGGECWLMTQGWPKVFEQKGKETLQYDIMCRKKVGRNTQTESVDAYNLSQQTRRTCSMAYGRAATTPWPNIWYYNNTITILAQYLIIYYIID